MKDRTQFDPPELGRIVWEVPLGPTDERVRQALEQFVRNIEITGGIFRDESGHAYPLADPEWLDLADTYLTSCAALGIAPRIANEPDEPQGDCLEEAHADQKQAVPHDNQPSL